MFRHNLFLFFLLTTAFASCTDLNPSTEPPDIGNPGEIIAFFFTADVDGEEFATELADEGDAFTGLVYFHDSIRIEGACRYDYGVQLNDGSSPIVPSIELQNFYNGDCEGEIALFDQLYFSEEVAFHDVSDPTTEKSAIVSIQYPDGLWSSQFGDNQNAEFRVTGGTPANTTEGRRQKVTGRFSCTLYKEGDPEETKTVQNGEFEVNFTPATE